MKLYTKRMKKKLQAQSYYNYELFRLRSFHKHCEAFKITCKGKKWNSRM